MTVDVGSVTAGIASHIFGNNYCATDSCCFQVSSGLFEFPVTWQNGIRNGPFEFFQDDCEDLIRSLKMETDVNEVCLVEAAALVAMVEAKLRNPLQLSLGPDGLQRLFSNSGIITAEEVLENLS